MLKTVETMSQSTFLLFIRVYWGWQFFQTGFGKTRDISKPIAYFASLNVPMHEFSAYMVAGTELVGGVLLIFGLMTRPVTAMLTVNMLGAYYFGDFEALGSLLSNPDAFASAAPFSFLFASLVALFFGGGSFSLDHAITWWRGRKWP